MRRPVWIRITASGRASGRWCAAHIDYCAAMGVVLPEEMLRGPMRDDRFAFLR